MTRLIVIGLVEAYFYISNPKGFSITTIKRFVMSGFSPLTKERFAAYMFAWLTTLVALWAGIPVIRKGIIDVLWQLYDFFLGK